MKLRLAGLGFLLTVFLWSQQDPVGCTSCETSGGLVWQTQWPVVDLPDTVLAPATGTLTGKLTFSRRRPPLPLVVYLERPDGEYAFSVPAEPLTIRQQQARFHPDFAALVRGQKVIFVNDEVEAVDHNVYLLGAEKTDLGIFARKVRREHVFAGAGVVEVYCSIHNQMDAKLFVAPNPHFFVLEAGNDIFTLTGVPAGRWRLKTWQRSRRFEEANLVVEVAAGRETEIVVEMSR